VNSMNEITNVKNKPLYVDIKITERNLKRTKI